MAVSFVKERRLIVNVYCHFNTWAVIHLTVNLLNWRHSHHPIDYKLSFKDSFNITPPSIVPRSERCGESEFADVSVSDTTRFIDESRPVDVGKVQLWLSARMKVGVLRWDGLIPLTSRHTVWNHPQTRRIERHFSVLFKTFQTQLFAYIDWCFNHIIYRLPTWHSHNRLRDIDVLWKYTLVHLCFVSLHSSPGCHTREQHQLDIFSPLLFVLMIDPLIRIIKRIVLDQAEILYNMEDMKASVDSIETERTINKIVKRYATSVGRVINKRSVIQLNIKTPLSQSLQDIHMLDW